MERLAVPWAPWILSIVAWLCVLGVVHAASAAPGRSRMIRVEAVAVDLEIHRGGDRLERGKKVPWRRGVVDATAVYQLSRPAEPGDSLYLLNFAEALPAEDPRLAELDALARASYLDGPYNPGRLEVTDVGAAAVARVGARRDLVVTPPPGATEVRLSYRVTVPRRYWPFGCARRRCSLGGAVAPLPSVAAEGGRSLAEGARVVDPARWTVQAKFAEAPGKREDPEVILVDQPFAGSGVMAYPSVFWGERWRRVTHVHRGVEIEVLHLLWRPKRQHPDEGKAQLYRDVPGHIIDVAREVIDLALESGVAVPHGTRLRVIQGPLRSHVAGLEPGVAVVSDQALQLVPGGRFFEFHRAAIARALLDVIAHGQLAGVHDPSTDLWLQGAVGMALFELWVLRERHGDTYARDVLGKWAFLPAVDSFLYTGQAAFAAMYFRGGEDPMPLRNHALWFANNLPTGRRIHEKLRDLLGDDKLLGFYRQVLAEPSRDPKAIAARSYGHELGWFFEQWLGAYPALDYRIVGVTKERRGDGYRYQITIERDGAVGVVEPVQVLVVERGGERHYLAWNGDDGRATTLDAVPRRARHTFEIDTKSRVRSVELDPRARLVQTPQGPVNVDPRFNDRRPAAGRFLYTGFGLTVAFSEFFNARTAEARLAALSMYLFFEGSRRRDLSRTGHWQIYTDRTTTIGTAGGIQFWFGGKVNNQRRRTRLRLFADIGHVNGLGLDPRGGLRLEQTVAIVDDTRKFSRWPDSGQRFALSARATEVLRVDGGLADHRYALTITGAWVRLWALAHQHVLATRLEGSVVVPLASDLEYRLLLRPGGIGDLDGYSGSELYTRAYLLAGAEYRHVFFNNLDINVVHLAWLRSLGGVLSAGAVSMAHCDDYGGLLAADSWYGQVGYGLFGYTYLLGVAPQLVRLDVSVPLVRRDTVCLGNAFPQYLADRQNLDSAEGLLAPVNVNLTFVQPF